MDLAAFHELRTATGQGALLRAAELDPTDATLLACAIRLRADYPTPLATAALETVLLRRKASAKFARADQMYFTREALEQSTSETVSRYRAERFDGFARVADWCCGIGGDTIGLAAVTRVNAMDSDPLRLAMAEANAAVYGLRGRVEFQFCDVLQADLSAFQAVFADPHRRVDGRRVVSLNQYQPSLDALLSCLPRGFPIGIKVAPGVPEDEFSVLDAEAEFISLDGELKECALWFGPMRTTRRRATLLPGRHTLFGERGGDCGLSEPRAFLYDPDPAVVRSGLITQLGQMLDARLIDPQIAFLTADTCQSTPFAATYRIDERHGFNLALLTKRLRALNVGRLTVVKRGSPVDPELLQRRCKRDGTEHRTVILTRTAGKPLMLIGERVSP